MPRVTITVADKTPQPYRFSLERKVVTIGRGADNDIIIDCPSVSGQHAEMHRVEGGYELRDCDSTNGIKLNGRAARLIALKNGQEVLLGDVDFDFQLKDDELAILGSEAAMAEPTVEVEPVGDPLPPMPKTQPADAVEEVEPEPEEDYEEEEVVEAPQRRPSRAPQQGAPAASKAGGLAFTVVSAVLVVVAFIGGMAIRYGNEMDGSYIKAVMRHMAGEDDGGASSEKDGE